MTNIRSWTARKVMKAQVLGCAYDAYVHHRTFAGIFYSKRLRTTYSDE